MLSLKIIKKKNAKLKIPKTLNGSFTFSFNENINWEELQRKWNTFVINTI